MKRVLSVIVVSLTTSIALADNCHRVRAINCVAPVKAVVPVVEVQRNHYYSIDSYYQQSLLADAIVGRFLQLQMKHQNGTQRPTTSDNSNNNISTIPNGVPNGNILPIGISSYQNSDLASALKNNCAKCHDGKTRTAFLSQDDKILDLPKYKVLEVYHLVNTGKMPKAGPPLEDKFMPLLDAWVGGSK